MCESLETTSPPSTRYHLTTAPHHGIDHHNFNFSQLLLVRATWQQPRSKRTDDWGSPKHFHKYAQQYAHKYATRFRAEMQREEAREWTVFPKEEPGSGNSMPAKRAKKEACLVLLTGSVIQQNITKLASIGTRSTAAQTVDSVSDGSSLLHWLTSTATTSTATQTSDPGEMGGRCSNFAPFRRNTGWSSKGCSTVSS